MSTNSSDSDANENPMDKYSDDFLVRSHRHKVKNKSKIFKSQEINHITSKGYKYFHSDVKELMEHKVSYDSIGSMKKALG